MFARRWWILVLALAWMGCEKKPVVEAMVDQTSVHPDLTCPADTKPTGKGPPTGVEVWCVKQLANAVVRDGPAIEWYTNEQRKAAGSYTDDKKSGGWEYWYPTGKPKLQGSYVRGVQDGFWTAFHPTGERKSEGQMVDGKEHGKWTYWGEDGTKVEGAWILGERDGTWLDYDDAGVPKRERNYRGGRLINQREVMPKEAKDAAKKTGG